MLGAMYMPCWEGATAGWRGARTVGLTERKARAHARPLHLPANRRGLGEGRVAGLSPKSV